MDRQPAKPSGRRARRISMSIVSTDSARRTAEGDRFNSICRPYSKADVDRLRGSILIRHTLAELGAARLWELLHTEAFVPALGALTGNQAVQMVRAGLRA